VSAAAQHRDTPNIKNIIIIIIITICTCAPQACRLIELITCETFVDVGVEQRAEFKQSVVPFGVYL
jgi:hypothetical protein